MTSPPMHTKVAARDAEDHGARRLRGAREGGHQREHQHVEERAVELRDRARRGVRPELDTSAQTAKRPERGGDQGGGEPEALERPLGERQPQDERDREHRARHSRRRGEVAAAVEPQVDGERPGQQGYGRGPHGGAILRSTTAGPVDGIKRAMDLVGSAVGLVLLSPVVARPCPGGRRRHGAPGVLPPDSARARSSRVPGDEVPHDEARRPRPRSPGLHREACDGQGGRGRPQEADQRPARHPRRARSCARRASTSCRSS